MPYPDPTYDHPVTPLPAVGLRRPYMWDARRGFWTCQLCAGGQTCVTSEHLTGGSHQKRAHPSYDWGRKLPRPEWDCHPKCEVCYPCGYPGHQAAIADCGAGYGTGHGAGLGAGNGAGVGAGHGAARLGAGLGAASASGDRSWGHAAAAVAPPGLPNDTILELTNRVEELEDDVRRLKVLHDGLKATVEELKSTAVLTAS